jgi:beta-galactosidase
MKISHCWALVYLFFCFVAADGQTQKNLSAETAYVRASDEAAGHQARNASDGSPDSYWECSGSGAAPCWIEFGWKDPVSIRELVVRRYPARRGAKDLTHFKAELFENRSWHTIAASGDGNAPLPMVIYLLVPQVAGAEFRISELEGNARIQEIELYSQKTPAWIDVRGDDRGNAIGIVTDGFGAAGIRAEVQASGRAAGKPWKASAQTGSLGEFTLPLPLGITGPIEFLASWQSESIRKLVDAGDIQTALAPDPGSPFDLELNGSWSFQPDPPKGFERPTFEDSSWKKIEVPSHWVMQGFHAQHGSGGYRKHVRIPAEWRGRQVRIAFDGVYSAAEVWWNGRRIGSHIGGATSFQLEVPPPEPGSENVLAVLVKEQSPASDLDHMSMYADFSLAGIYRRAHLFSVPVIHLQRQQSYAQFDQQYRDADLVTELSLVNGSASSAANTSARLILSREGQGEVSTSDPVPFDVGPWSRKDERIKLHVQAPLKWNSEKPNLYELETIVSQNGHEIERIKRKIGFRQTRIDHTALLIDGTAVKLKGTAHHDSHPLLGRAVTPAVERRDLELMKEANIDAVRTSHYPPIPELDDIADELGLYIEEEAPFCWANGNDLRWAAFTRQVAAEMVERDMSHPSVAYWSGGNESDWGPALDLDVNEIRAHDPSRPVMGSWTNNVDFTIRHNPITVKGIHSLDGNDKPVLWDESLAPYQGIWGDGNALWRDPGIRDYYVVPLIDVMEAFWSSKVVQASFIWAWADDMFLVPGRGIEQGRGFTEDRAAERIYYKKGYGLVGDAPWGIIDGWRRKKPEFWNIQNLYSPIALTARSVAIPSAGSIRIPVTNRYFFTNLSEVSTEWRVAGEKGTVTTNIPPQTSGFIEVPLPAGIQPGAELQLRFTNGNRLVNAFTVAVGEAQPNPPAPQSAASVRLHSQEQLSGVSSLIEGDAFSLGVTGERGLLRYAVVQAENVLYNQPQVHIFPMHDAPAFPRGSTWTLDRPIDISQNDGEVTIAAQGHYPNLVGTYSTVINPGGDVIISYDFEYTGPQIDAQEIGFRFEVPSRLDHLSWTRKGDWTWYPEDHIDALTGDVPAYSGKPSFVEPDWPYADDDSPMGSNGFRSTKRNIIRAELKDESGRGWRIQSDGSQSLRAAIESDRIAVYVNDWYGGTPAEIGEYLENYGPGKLLRTGEHLSSTIHLHFLSGSSPDSQ